MQVTEHYSDHQLSFFGILDELQTILRVMY